MSRIKRVNVKDFSKMDYEQKVKTVKSLSKRANVRLDLLREKGIENDAYKLAEYYNDSKGRKKNKFYEGTQYESQKELNTAFKYLSKFLNNEGSTLGGIQHDVNNKIESLINKGELSYESIKKMSEQEKIYASQKMATLSNRRIKELDNNNVHYGAVKQALAYNNATGRKNNTFYRGSKFNSIRDLNIHIQNEISFLNAKTSTMEGIINANEKRLNKFREKGVNIPKGKEKEFFDFLSSNQFKNISKYADSNQVLQTFADARKINTDVDEINKAFTEFMNGEIDDFTEVQERLNVAKWQNNFFK